MAHLRSLVDVVFVEVGHVSDLVVVTNALQVIGRVVIFLAFNELRPRNFGLGTIIDRSRILWNPRLWLDLIWNHSRGTLSYFLILDFFFLLFLRSRGRSFLPMRLIEHLQEISRKA